VTGLIIYMAQAITSVGFIGFGFRDIGAGITIIKSGFTVITHHAKSAHLLNWDDIRITPGPELLRQPLDAK